MSSKSASSAYKRADGAVLNSAAVKHLITSISMIKVVFKKTIVGSGFHFRKGAEVELSNDRAQEVFERWLL